MTTSKTGKTELKGQPHFRLRLLINSKKKKKIKKRKKRLPKLN